VPELHEIMNIFADYSEQGGAYPPMPKVSDIIGERWLTMGRYHFHEKNHVFKGFDFKDVEIWWSWTESTTYYAQDQHGSSMKSEHKTDYAGYKLAASKFWDGTVSTEKDFVNRLDALAQVAAGLASSESYSAQAHQKISDIAKNLDLFFKEKQEELLKEVRSLYDKDAAIEGNAANMFANHLYRLSSRLENLSKQLSRFRERFDKIRPALVGPSKRLLERVREWRSSFDNDQSMRSSVYWTIYDWYNTTHGTQRFVVERDQFAIRYSYYSDKPEVWGIVGDEITDTNINNILHQIWLGKLKPVTDAANELYSAISTEYPTAIPYLGISKPEPKNLPGFNGPQTTPDGPGGGNNPNINFPDINFPEINIPDVTIPDDFRVPPPTITGGPSGGGIITGGPDSDFTLPPSVTTGGPSGGGIITGGPDSDFTLPPSVTTGGPSGLSDLGTVPPLLPPPTTSFSSGSSGMPGPRRSSLATDPETGLPINPRTGEPFPVNPETGLPYDPDTGLPIQLDPETGLPLPIDPLTGEIITAGPGTQAVLDPETGLPINPETGESFPVNPETGLPYNPDTGLPVVVDTDSGLLLPIDPQTGLPYNPDTGEIITSSGRGTQADLDGLLDYDIPRLETPDFDSDDLPGTSLPRSYTTVGPGGSGINIPSGMGGDSGGSSDRSTLFTTPETLGRAAGSPGGSGFMTPPPIGEGAADVGSVKSPGSLADLAQQPGMGGMPPMMPMAGNPNNQERTRSTWLAEDESVWGTSPKNQKSVLGRPLPGEEKKGSIRERIDTGAGGAGSRTASQTDGGVRAGKRKPGVISRRGHLQGPDGGRQGQRQGGTD